MRIGKVDIHPAKQVMIHVKAIGVFVLGRHADVFVQVERAAPREVQAFLLVFGDQPVIDAFHRAAGGHPNTKSGLARNRASISREVSSAASSASIRMITSIKSVWRCRLEKLAQVILAGKHLATLEDMMKATIFPAAQPV